LNGSYDPKVEVSTQKLGDKIVITVRDNGMGIPQKVIDKFFNLFIQQNQQGREQGWDFL
jgi:C4-dicarboxylate-specific signal transduction histidine kinase